MELTYTIRGADGKDYGPATLSQLGGWIREGRVLADQEVRRSDMEHWARAVDFTELHPEFTATAAAPPERAASPSAAARPQPATSAQLRSGASWFYWIAGMSLINSIAAFSGGTWRFIIGLGVTQILDGFGNHIGSGGRVVALLLDLVAAGVFVFLGVFAHKAHAWAFLVGIVLFAMDGLIFLLVQDWLGVGFHVFVLYFLFRGLNACKKGRGLLEEP